MRLVTDANILVAGFLRARGRALIAYPALALTIAETVWDEAEHELRKRIALMTARGTLAAEVTDHLLDAVLITADDRIEQIPQAVCDMHEIVARSRIPRDPDDWHTVALAIAINADIWTNDADFLGCGVATWTTNTLLAHLAYVEAE
jgi:predicted nucleic acid-binding protein